MPGRSAVGDLARSSTRPSTPPKTGADRGLFREVLLRPPCRARTLNIPGIPLQSRHSAQTGV